MNLTLRRMILVLVTLVTPVFLILTAIRILFTPLTIQLEYRAPGFPPDVYGFTTQDRLKWAGISMEYLLNDSPISPSWQTSACQMAHRCITSAS
jgi:hypothetical protein